MLIANRDQYSIPIIMGVTAVFTVGECALDEPQTGCDI